MMQQTQPAEVPYTNVFRFIYRDTNCSLYSKDFTSIGKKVQVRKLTTAADQIKSRYYKCFIR